MIKPPRAEKIDNDYAWLREKENPAVLDYLKRENAHTEAVMADTAALQESLVKEFKSRIKETDETVPAKLDNYHYYSRTVAGEQYGIYCRKEGSLEAPEEIILNLNDLAREWQASYLSLGSSGVSPDHRYLAAGFDLDGGESFTIKVKDLKTGAWLSDEIKDTYYSLAWASDSQSFFYTKFDSTHRPDRVYRHVLGSKAEEDKLIYEEKGTNFNVSVRLARSRELIFIDIENKNTTESWWLDARRPEAPSRLARRRKDIEYYPDHHTSGKLYILTNDGAKNFRLMEAALEAPERKPWQELVPERGGVTLEDFDLFSTHLVLSLREKTLPQIEILDLTTREIKRLNFAESIYALESEVNLEFNSPTFRFAYSSLVTPHSIYEYNFSTGEKVLLKQQEIPSGYDSTQYESHRLWAKAEDGTEIPISIVYKKPRSETEPRPLLLYGYGAYEHVIEASFSTTRLALLERGMIYAVAHVRGGGEGGREWYEQGKFLNKKNTFTDFIACAEYLIKAGYTNSNELVALGRSAGGLLMGAIANLAPQLFHTIVADVPFVDTLSTMLDPTLPLTTLEYGELGNPEEKKFYDYIASYSPYDNVTAKSYPNMLVTGGLNDPRVGFWEPAKWVAKLRELKTDHNLLLLKTNLGAGHAGASGRYDALRELAFEFAFILKTLGL